MSTYRRIGAAPGAGSAGGSASAARRTPSRRRAVRHRVPALVAGALLAGGVLLPQPAEAAVSAHPRATTLLATSQYILWRQQTSAAALRPDGLSGGSVYATDIAGQRMSLPGFDNRRQRLFMTESLVVQAQSSVVRATDRQTIRYLDLNDRKGGTSTGEAGESLVGAAPDGWLTERSTGTEARFGTPQRITYVHRDGTRTDLGVPFPDGQTAGLVISDTGIVATPGVSDETSFRTTVVYQPWKAVGTTWRTLYTDKYEQVAINCAPSSTTAVACERSPEEGEGEGPYTHGLISLTGAGARWISNSHPKACRGVEVATFGSSLVAVETTDAGTCTKGRLYRFTFGTDLTYGGSHHYSSTGIRVGLRGFTDSGSRIILSSTDQRHIDALTGITKSPFVIVRV